MNKLENMVLELKVLECDNKKEEYEELLNEIIIYLKEVF